MQKALFSKQCSVNEGTPCSSTRCNFHTNVILQLIAQLSFVAILPYLNPNGISRGAHVDNSGNEEYYEYGPGEYLVQQEYHTDYYGNRYGKYDRKDEDKKNKLLDIELQKPIDIDLDGDKRSVTVQGRNSIDRPNTVLDVAQQFPNILPKNYSTMSPNGELK